MASTLSPNPKTSYRGRFAPSPTGRLHLGSLLSGYGAMWRARSQNGTFLVRIEDLDFTRCTTLNLALMYHDLQLFHLLSEEQILVQGADTEPYETALEHMLASKQAYYCNCTRAQLKQRPCSCNTPEQQAYLQQLRAQEQNKQASCQAAPQQAVPQQAAPMAIRADFKQQLQAEALQSFSDVHLGPIHQTDFQFLPQELALKRSDGCYAYNLAVVVDDHRQGITEVVRGADLLETTFLQLALYQSLGYTPPVFCHLPLLTDDSGQKFSKQNHATPVIMSYSPLQAALLCWQLLQPHQVAALNDTAAPVIAELEELTAELKTIAATIMQAHIDDNQYAKYAKEVLATSLPLAAKQLQHSASQLWPSTDGDIETFILNSLLYAGWQQQQMPQHITLSSGTGSGYGVYSEYSCNFPTFGEWLLNSCTSHPESSMQQVSACSKHYYEALEQLHQCCGQLFELAQMPTKSIVL